MRAAGRILLGAVITAGFIFVAASAAGAQTRPADPKLGDVVGTDVSPHGGYSTSTNMCRQCHSVHDSTSEIALVRGGSVQATCNTCHALGGVGGTSPKNSVFGGSPTLIGTASTRSAYEATSGDGHDLGANSIPERLSSDPDVVTASDFDYPGLPSTDSTEVSPEGLYCASCHTPHGDFGQLVNNWTTADEGNAIWWDPAGSTRTWEQGYLYLDTTRTDSARNVPGVWQACDDSALTTGCEDLLVDDADGSASGDPAYLYGYKLLTKNPNHTYSADQTYNTDKYNHDGSDWCATCHTKVRETSTSHRHPTGCTACHGNPASDSGFAQTKDFPHTSSIDRLIKKYPDALCIGCHTSGNLP